MPLAQLSCHGAARSDADSDVEVELPLREEVSFFEHATDMEPEAVDEASVDLAVVLFPALKAEVAAFLTELQERRPADFQVPGATRGFCPFCIGLGLSTENHWRKCMIRHRLPSARSTTTGRCA